MNQLIVPDPGGGYVEFSANKTLFVQKFTEEDPIKPEIIPDLTTIAEVFNYFKPASTCNLFKGDEPITEKFAFSNLEDFTPESLALQSQHLAETKMEMEVYGEMMHEIKTNKVLRSVLSDNESKESFLSILKALSEELRESN